MREPRGTCYPSGPVPDRGCYPEAPDTDGCYSQSPLRALLRAVTAPTKPAQRPAPRSWRLTRHS
jgi:hypothetical protein